MITSKYSGPENITENKKAGLSQSWIYVTYLLETSKIILNELMAATHCQQVYIDHSSETWLFLRYRVQQEVQRGKLNDFWRLSRTLTLGYWCFTAVNLWQYQVSLFLVDWLFSYQSHSFSSRMSVFKRGENFSHWNITELLKSIVQQIERK